MYDTFLKLFLGIIFLLVSTKVLIKLAEKLSASLKISPLVVGLTVVALGTSLPELSVASIASLKSDIGLATGNIVGANIINILLVFPIAILAGKLRIGTTKTQYNALILFIVTAIFVALHSIPLGNFPLGLFLIGLAILLTIAEYKWAIFGRTHEDSTRMKKVRREHFATWKWFVLLASIGGIIVGGYLTVSSIEQISLLTGYSTTVLGLSLTALATTLPELLTTLFSQKDHQEKLTIGNIIGSNIYNLLFIGGIISLFSTSKPIQTRDWIALSSATILFVLVIKHYSGQKVPRWIAFVSFAILGGYLYMLSTTN